MRTLEAAEVAVDEIVTLVDVTERLPEDSHLRDFLSDIIGAVRSGEDVSVVAAERQMTPSQAAKWLGVSRVHVYKLMDRGDLPFVRVGNDRRTTFADIEAFKASQDETRREMAVRAARPDATRRSASHLL